MSTRANIFIIDSIEDADRECLYHHCDGFPEYLGRDLKNILHQLPKDENGVVLNQFFNKKNLAKFICETDDRFEITTPCIAGDSEYDYEINLAKREVIWRATSWSAHSGDQDWLCDF